MIKKKDQKEIITLESLHAAMIDGFDKVFFAIDESAKEVKRELRAEIHDLRNEMNERFSSVDKRLSYIENNAVFKHDVVKDFA
jgi:ElaB/YqjD/DUF883 family membrane-anchored ribosome-binding protein